MVIGGTRDKRIGHGSTEVHGTAHQRLLLVVEQHIVIGCAGRHCQGQKQIYDMFEFHHS